MAKKDLAQIDAALFALLKEKGPQTRMDILEAVDALSTVEEADAGGSRLVRAGVATVTTLDDGGCVDMDAVAKLCGADGVEAGAVQETPKRKGRPPGSKNKPKGGAK